MKKIAVIGAGMAGLTLAHMLQAAGRSVTVYEKSRGPGGRCSTRRTDTGPFDHGAPWLQAVTPTFVGQVQQWQDLGGLERLAQDSGNAAWCIRPQMDALGQRLSDGLEVRAGLHIAAIERTQAGWLLRALAPADSPPDAHDAVVVAVPAEQAAALLYPDRAQAEAMRQTVSDPCWTVMAAWPCPLPLQRGVWRGHDPLAPLDLAIRQTVSASAGGTGERWVLHATAAWSRQNLDAAPEAVMRRLLTALAATAGVRLAPPSFRIAHRWRYAQVPRPHPDTCGWNPTLRLGACGDAWHGTPGARGIERAWLSAKALSTTLLADGPH